MKQITENSDPRNFKNAVCVFRDCSSDIFFLLWRNKTLFCDFNSVHCLAEDPFPIYKKSQMVVRFGIYRLTLLPWCSIFSSADCLLQWASLTTNFGEYSSCQLLLSHCPRLPTFAPSIHISCAQQVILNEFHRIPWWTNISFWDIKGCLLCTKRF